MHCQYQCQFFQQSIFWIQKISELPDTSFTRSISNHEAVMRRRRQQKLEKKLQQFRSKDGGPDTGGTLKVCLCCCVKLLCTVCVIENSFEKLLSQHFYQWHSISYEVFSNVIHFKWITRVINEVNKNRANKYQLLMWNI